MKSYEVMDMRAGMFRLLEAAPVVEARTPKAAIEKHTGKACRRTYYRSGDCLVRDMDWPYRTYLYNIA